MLIHFAGLGRNLMFHFQIDFTNVLWISNEGTYKLLIILFNFINILIRCVSVNSWFTDVIVGMVWLPKSENRCS